MHSSRNFLEVNAENGEMGQIFETKNGSAGKCIKKHSKYNYNF